MHGLNVTAGSHGEPGIAILADPAGTTPRRLDHGLSIGALLVILTVDAIARRQSR